MAEKQDPACRQPAAGCCASGTGPLPRACWMPAAAAAAGSRGSIADRADLEGVLHTTSLMRSAAQNVRDLVAGYGELWSTTPVYRLSRRRAARALRRRALARCPPGGGGGVGPAGPGRAVGCSRARLTESGAAEFNGTLIIPGFVARTPQGVQTTLGRNGSDFSASIFGALLDASEIHIWTDVDGVLSADPRRVPNAQVIDQLSYNEAMELAYFGAKVIHPQTMAPAIGRAIPIYIRNTFAPRQSLHADLRQADLEAAGEGHHHHRERRAGQHRGRGHDRRARHRAPAVRCAARRGHLGHPDLAGQLRAFHLLRHSRRAGRARRARGARALSRASSPKARSRASRPATRAGHPRGGGRWHGRHAGRLGQGVQCTRARPR